MNDGNHRKSSDAKKTELQDGAEVFLAVFEGAQDGILVAEISTKKFVLANPRICELTGYSRDELYRLGVEDIHPAACLPAVIAHFEGALPSKTLLPADFPVLRKDGSVVYCQIVGHTIKVGNQELLLGSFRNITERKRAEEALRLKNLVFDQSIAANSVADRDGNLTEVNGGFLKCWGYARKEEVLGRPVSHFLQDPAEAAKILEALRHAGRWEGEFSARRKDGSLFTAFSSANVVRDEQGALIGFQSSVQDITERRRMEEALRESEEKLAALFSSMTEMVVLHDLVFNERGEAVNYRILDCNQAYTEITGIRREDALGRLGTEVYGTPEPPYLKEFSGVALSGIPFKYTTYFAPMQKHFAVSVVSPRKNHFATVTTDITERKRAEEEKRGLEAELQQAQKLESLGILAGGIAHDYNNLMAGLFGCIEKAQREAAEGAVAEVCASLEKAMLALERGRDLTRQLLTFAKGGEPAKRPEHMPPLLRDAADVALSGSSVTIDFQIPAGLWVCAVDKHQLFQALSNIFINAKEAMPAGGAVSVRAENVPPSGARPEMLAPGSYVRISISNDGPGISPQILAHIFDPFFTTKDKGHGLGLSMVHSILKRHGGLVTAASEPGAGTAFHLYLPTASAAPADAPPEAPRETRPGRGRILIMDDDKMVLELSTALLQRSGYSVAQTACGEEAIRIYREALNGPEPFAAVILDLTVRGGMGGKEAIDRLRAIDPEVVALVSSGYSSDPIMTAPQRFGFKGALAKPYRGAEMAELLRRVLPDRGG